MAALLPTLYHGSGFKNPILQPGFLWTGKLVEWDETESNKFLYATTNREEAIAMGLGSLIEKTYLVDKYHYDDKKIVVELNERSRTVKPDDIRRMVIFLYTIHPSIHDGWIKNNNDTNGMTTEWKTDHVVNDGFSTETIEIAKWLGDKEVIVHHPVQTPHLEKKTKTVKPKSRTLEW